MSATDEKNLLSVANFVPMACRIASGSSLSTCAETPAAEDNTPLSEEKLINRLAALLDKHSMLPEELGLLYSYRFAASFEDELKAMNHPDGNLKVFLENQKCFSFLGKHVKLVEAWERLQTGTGLELQTEFDCNEDDDDIEDFASATSDNEADNTIDTPPVDDDVATEVYSKLMLLRLRGACCRMDASDVPLRYGTRPRSEFPASASSTPTSTIKAQIPTQDPFSPAEMAMSWRQALPTATADSWVARQRNQNPDEDAAVQRAARSILNKLTVEKFDSLFDQLATCGVSHPHHISILMSEIFDVATTQHHFIPMYAELCSKLEMDPRIAAVVDEADQLHNFKRILLNQCQSVFQQLLESYAEAGMESCAKADMDGEFAFRRKQQALGNMKLIGQLLVNGMLSSDLFTECCETLLSKRSECPEALESLVALMMVAGPKFDGRAWQYYQKLEKIIADMGALTKDKSVPPRLRFLIRDVLDARSAGWPQCRRAGKSPSKLEEVRNAPLEQQVSIEADWTDGPQKGIQCPASGKKAVNFCLKEEVADALKEVGRKLSTSVPGVAAPPKQEDKGFKIIDFRRTLASIFTDLASDKNVPAAVQRIRLQDVPVEQQAEQFVDMLTRVVEDRRGAVRRCELAFLAGLAAAERSAFDRKECLAGVELFFKDVYPELCNEVHRLPTIMKSEFMPTMANVFPTAELNKVVPVAMRK
jgi:hypothetical protein